MSTEFIVWATIGILVRTIGILLEAWAIATCFQKGKRVYGALGAVGLLVPGLGLFAFVGALRLAKPSSPFAVKRYSRQEMDEAIRRYPEDPGPPLSWRPRISPQLEASYFEATYVRFALQRLFSGKSLRSRDAMGVRRYFRQVPPERTRALLADSDPAEVAALQSFLTQDLVND